MTELAACACFGGGNTSPERAVDSSVIRKGLAYFFVVKGECVEDTKNLTNPKP